jgi:hypothetical protein
MIRRSNGLKEREAWGNKGIREWFLRKRTISGEQFALRLL